MRGEQQGNLVIRVEGVSKDFLLPHRRTRSVKQAFTELLNTHDTATELQHALQDISFDVRKGEFLGIVGRNGSCKSTLLKILAGIYQPSKGNVKIQGKLVPFIELGVGFNPELTGRENVYLNGALLGFSKKEVDGQYKDIVAFAELEEFMDQKLKNYSSGMQVRLAFSVAIIAQADILLIDEVLAVGDADFQRKCFDYFKQLKRNKQTVVFVSHDMGAVQQYCDRALLIEDSKIVEIGAAGHISTLYSKLFIDNGSVAQEESQKDALRAKNLSASGEERWGDGQAQWKSVAVHLVGAKSRHDEPTHIAITATGKARQDIAFPIFGFSIKNADFLQLIGTNTMRKQIAVKPLIIGQTFSITWQVPNIFNTGVHYVDCTIAHDQASMVSDRWPDATSFHMSRVEDNPYPVYADVGCHFGVDK